MTHMTSWLQHDCCLLDTVFLLVHLHYPNTSRSTFKMTRTVSLKETAENKIKNLRPSCHCLKSQEVFFCARPRSSLWSTTIHCTPRIQAVISRPRLYTVCMFTVRPTSLTSIYAHVHSSCVSNCKLLIILGLTDTDTRTKRFMFYCYNNERSRLLYL